MMSKIELLLPAGDLSRCKVALTYGADAVYIGGQQYSLRSRASNFSLAAIAEAGQFAHKLNKKIYVTVNMIFHNDDLIGIEDYLESLSEAGVDAIIVASPYLLSLVKAKKYPFEVHMSTQLSLLNSEDIKFYQQQGADRVILARELSITEISLLKQKTTLPLEVFIHGAMCANYSGRCTLSNEMTNRDANRGGCAQSCRWKYRLFKDEILISDPECLFSMSSKDLVGINYIGDLINLGITSLKIEGRMKSSYYLAVLAKAYRSYIDLYYQDQLEASQQQQSYQKEIARAENRLTATGFFDHIPKKEDHLYDVNGARVNHDYVGNVLFYDNQKNRALIQVRNVIQIGDILEVLTPIDNKDNILVSELYNSDELALTIANQPMSEIWLPTEVNLVIGDMIRKKINE